MKPVKFNNGKISVRYGKASVFATGKLATIITYSLAGLFLLIGIAAIQSIKGEKNSGLKY